MDILALQGVFVSGAPAVTSSPGVRSYLQLSGTWVDGAVPVSGSGGFNSFTAMGVWITGSDGQIVVVPPDQVPDYAPGKIRPALHPALLSAMRRSLK